MYESLNNRRLYCLKKYKVRRLGRFWDGDFVNLLQRSGFAWSFCFLMAGGDNNNVGILRKLQRMEQVFRKWTINLRSWFDFEINHQLISGN